MREMHKWKDKVEFSLDNRQIFFLFFGLSVVGCFVFALGIMTGRRLQWDPGQQAAAVGGNSLALLEGEEQVGEGEAEERFAFKQGLSASDAESLPPTRDPEVPPADDDEVAARKEAEQRQAEQAEIEAKIEAQQQALAASSPAVAKPAAPSKPEAAPAEPPADAGKGDKRQFTLQMKAFSREEDAVKLADKLRSNGHDVRVESHEVRGRTWHRVRLGTYTEWNDALAAKDAFEKAEHVIAYVVSL